MSEVTWYVFSSQIHHLDLGCILSRVRGDPMSMKCCSSYCPRILSGIPNEHSHHTLELRSSYYSRTKNLDDILNSIRF